MQEDRTEHNGFVIHSAPCQLAEDGRWTLGVMIERHELTRICSAQYATALTTCGTEWEAKVRSLAFGRQVVDGEFPRLRLP